MAAMRTFLAAVESAWGRASDFPSIKRVRHIVHRCGGSLAQYDLIRLTFTEAALRARKARVARVQ